MATPAPIAPPVAEFEAIPDPFDRLAALNRLADLRGWQFPPEHAALRRATAHEARAQLAPNGKPYSLSQLGAMVRLSKTRLWQLLTAGKPAGPDAPTSGPAPTCAAPPTLPVPEPLLPAQRHMTVGGADANLTVPVSEATS